MVRYVAFGYREDEQFAKEMRYVEYALSGMNVKCVESEKGGVECAGEAGLVDLQVVAVNVPKDKRDSFCSVDLEDVGDKVAVSVGVTLDGIPCFVRGGRGVDGYSDLYELASKVFFALDDPDALDWYALKGKPVNGPLVTIIAVTRNHGHCLLGAIDSLRMQTYQNTRILVADDANTDDTEKVLEKFDGDAKVEVYRMEKREYIYGCSNFLLKMCEDGLVMRSDTDDYCSPVKLAKQVEALTGGNEAPEATFGNCVVGTGMYEVCRDMGSTIGIGGSCAMLPRRVRREVGNFEEAVCNAVVPSIHGTWLYEKEAVVDVGGYGGFRAGQDLELSARLVSNGVSFVNVEEELYVRVFETVKEDKAERSRARAKAIKAAAMVFVEVEDKVEALGGKFVRGEKPVMLQFCNSLDYGGTTTFALDLAKLFPEFRQVVMFANAPSPDCAKYFTEVEVETLVQNPFTSFAVSKYDPAVVVLNNPVTSNYDGCEWMSGVKKVTVFHTFTDLILPCDYYVFNSRCTRSKFDQDFGNEEIIYIGAFGDSGLEGKYLAIERNSGVGKCVFGRISSVNNRKKFPPTFSDIMDGVEAVFAMQGSEHYGRKDKKLRSLPIMLGREKLVEHYASFNVFLYHIAPLQESFGRVFVEAMFAGLPVVTDNLGGAKEIVLHGWNGFLCDDTEQFVDACNLLLEDEDLRLRMGENGRKLATKRFSHRVVRERFADVFRKIGVL